MKIPRVNARLSAVQAAINPTVQSLVKTAADDSH